MPRRSVFRQAASVATPHRVPLVTTIQNRDETFDKDARIVNGYAELEPIAKEYWVQKRPGLLEYDQLSGIGNGMYNWLGDLYSIFGGTLYKNEVSFGTVDSTHTYTFTEMLGDGWLVLGNGVKAYYTDGVTLHELQKFSAVYAGALLVGATYEIIDAGTSDFVAIGAADNNSGTQFVAGGLGDPLTTGYVALVVTSLLEGVTYQIQSAGSTDFTLVGAANSDPGTIFTATGVGIGTGTVYLPNFPSSFVKGWAYLDGTLYVMDSDARIWGTSTLSYGGIGGLDDPRLWDPLNVIVARSEPDRGVALRKHLSYVMAFKQWTVEAFYDAGNDTGSPLRPVQGALCIHGCASTDSIQSIDGTLLWLTLNRTVSPQIARMDDLRATIISTPPIERLLDQVALTHIHSWVFKHGGHRFYGLTIVTSNLTLVYDLDQNLWYQWTDADGNYWPVVDKSYNNNNQHILQHESNGKLYLSEGDYQYPNDDGDVVPVDIYTANFDAGIDRRKQLNIMRFNADQCAGSKLFIRCSDDDYQTWTNFREVSLETKRPILTDCGTFYRRAWHIRHYANTPLRLKTIDLQMDIGTL